MYLDLDHQSGAPIYRQIVDGVKYYVATGRLAAGEKLPSVRTLSKDLRVNPSTVVKAYDTLTAERVAYARQGQGVFVADGAPRLMKQEKVDAIAHRSRELWVEALHLGLTEQETRGIFDGELGRIKRARRRQAGDGR